MNGDVRIQFLNHASIKIVTDTVTMVCDPWLWGPIFNNGWELIRPSEELLPVAADTDFVWLSHEHPDHFSPAFFKRLGDRKPEVLFQKTRDGRVAGYLAGQGFTVREIANHQRVPLSATAHLTVGRSGLYDSWNLFESHGTRILNLNDCIIKTRGDIRALKKRVGRVDVLLTQFSYAGWVGDPSEKRLHEDAARRRLDVVRRQIEHLEPASVIPFASFAWYCHEENAYLNASVNRIPDFLRVCAEFPSTPVVLAPLDAWRVGEAHDNTEAVRFWEREYDAIPSRELRPTPPATDLDGLRSRCAAYQRRIFEKNSRGWMRLASLVPVLQVFRPVRIRLTDLGRTVRFSFFDELREADDQRPADVEMSSDSLAFMFAHDFGFDTLMVNARCRATAKGLDRLLRNFAIGNLNTMGWAIGPGLVAMLVREFRLVWLVVRELKNANPE